MPFWVPLLLLVLITGVIAAHVYLATRPWVMWQWAVTLVGALLFVSGGRKHPESIPWLAGGIVAIAAVAAFYVRLPNFTRWAWKVVAALGVVLLATLLYLGLVWAPAEQFMSDVGRILYVHVPHVWMCLLAFSLNVICSISYLVKQSWRVDALAEASAEVGLYFGACGVAMGSIWARPTWGVWWDWDPRLISTTVMLLAYAGYLALRNFTDDPERRATWSSASSILAYASLPIVWFSVQWWNSLHQTQSSPATVDSSMTVVLRWGAVTFLCFLYVFIVKRYEIARANQEGLLALPPVDAPPAIAGEVKS